MTVHSSIRPFKLALARRCSHLGWLSILFALSGCSGRIPHYPQTAAAPVAAPKSTTRREVDFMPSFSASSDQRTTADVLNAFGPYAESQLRPLFQRAGVSYPPRELTLLAFKAERQLEVWARGDGDYRWIRNYFIHAASGEPGPKLRQGDKQVPEGIYRIEGLNPNSKFHLSMKLNYPNEFDWFYAEEDGRDNLGSDIFIHGKDLSVGCLAMGDSAIEELFVLVAQTGRENVKVVIAPHDPEHNSLTASADGPAWVAELYRDIDHAIGALRHPVQASTKTNATMPLR